MTDPKHAIAAPETFIKNAETEALISYVATFRALRINKQNAIRCMLELDRRRQNGDDVAYEELIDSQAAIYKSVGKGFVVRIQSTANIEEVLKSITELQIPAMIYEKERGLIHIGKASVEVQTQISQLPGVQKIETDKSVLKNASSTKIFDVGEDPG